MKRTSPGNMSESENGFFLYTAVIMVLLIGAASGLILRSVRNQIHSIRRWHASDQSLLDAQSALEQVKYEIVRTFAESDGSLDWFETWSMNSIGDAPVYDIPSFTEFDGGVVAVTIAAVDVVESGGYVEIELIGGAARSEPFAVSRMIGETLRVTADPVSGPVPTVFDYAYLINGPAELKRNMRINGDIRSNSHLRLNTASTVNGERMANGRIMAQSPFFSLAGYWNPNNIGARARPTDPASADGIEWPMGYVSENVRNSDMPEMPFPSLGNMNALAGSVRGRIIQNGVVIVENYYDGPGPSGVPGAADDGCLVLDGSVSPVTIEGALVIKSDLIIRGQVRGRGTIYAGRNVHIAGDLAQMNPPAWPKPDADPDGTASVNAGKNFLLLAAKGNVVIGNYTAGDWSNRVWNIMTDPNRISSYAVEESDAVIGYDSDNDPSTGYVFNGRYYMPEAHGGRRLAGDGTVTAPRRYYESSLAYSAFNALSDPGNVRRIDAALFTNHAIIGSMGTSAPGGDPQLNGAMVCRNDMTHFYGMFTLNWDIRLGSESRDRINYHFLSGPSGEDTELSAITVEWKEIY